jgi:hypothetical protein
MILTLFEWVCLVHNQLLKRAIATIHVNDPQIRNVLE